MQPHGAVAFHFNPLSLTPEAVDELNSHGFIKYGVKCRNDVQGGDQIDNTAFIYFDFNPAIVTNTVSVTVTDPDVVNGVAPVIFSDALTVYPNPVQADGQVTVASNQNGVLEIVDLTGRRVRVVNVNMPLITLDLSGLTSGTYMMLMRTNDNSVKRTKLVVQ
jgi:hypothetical protein